MSLSQDPVPQQPHFRQVRGRFVQFLLVVYN